MISKRERLKILESAEKCVKSGKFLEAIREYEKLQGEEEGLDVNVTNIIGDLYFRLGKVDKAVKTFQKIAVHYESKGLYSQSLAIYKKINKIDPEDISSAVKLADLYVQLSFLSEAKEVYKNVAERLEKERHVKGLIFLYEKLLKIDRTDLRYRVKLAELYAKDGALDEATEMLNEVAEIKIESGDLEEGEVILQQAKAYGRNHVRTILSMITLLRKRNRKKEALDLAEKSLNAHRDNVDLLYRLGSLYVEEKKYENAGAIFSKLLEKAPNDLNIKVKLGYILIQQGRPDRAYELYEPLVNNLLSKNKEAKAIGLLGLTIMVRDPFIPALEKLAVIYKSKKQTKNLELVLRTLHQEYKKKKIKQKMLNVLRELVELCPQDAELAKEYAHFGKEPEPAPPVIAPPPTREKAPPAKSRLSVQDKDMIRINLSKAEMNIQQGYLRNARRILENLLILFPDEPVINKKLALIQDMESNPPPATAESPAPGEMPVRLAEEFAKRESREAEKKKEVKLEEKREEKRERAEAEEKREEKREEREEEKEEKEEKKIEEEERKEEEKVEFIPEGVEASSPPEPIPAATPSFEEAPEISAAELFADLTILEDAALKKFYDLAERIAEEKMLLEASVYQQLKKDTAVVEKDLREIVLDFKRHVEEKIRRDDHDRRYNLGHAFMDQGLYDEAVEEFILAAEDSSRTVDCFSLIGLCYRRKKNFDEARQWLNKALEAAPKDSNQWFAVKYEMAALYEETKEREQALHVFQEVKDWDATFRDVSSRVRTLKKASS